MKPSEFFVKKRSEVGISQSKLADLLGYSSQAVSAWENERSYPDLSIWSKYASILKVDLASFIECREAKENDNCDALMFDGDKFANNLKHLRKKKGFTQSQLAKKLDVNIKTISGWEQGTSYPSLNSFIALCSLFDLTYDEFYFALEKEKTPTKSLLNKKIVIPIISSLAIFAIAGTTIGIVMANTKNKKDNFSNEESSSLVSSSEEELSSEESISISNSSSESSISSIDNSSEETSSMDYSSISNEESSNEEPITDYQYTINGDDTATIIDIPDDITEITIPSSIDGHVVSRITKAAITNSSAYIDQTLKSLSLPSNVEIENFTSISFHAFPYLESVDIPINATYIAYNQFDECISLKEMTIPSQIEGIPQFLFSGCYNLKEVHIEADLKEISFCMFRYCNKLTGVNIPSTVATINEWAFQQCYLLPEIVLPESLKTIEADAFFKCESLKTVTIPSKTTTIKTKAFDYCTSLESIYIPKSVIFIGESAFTNCSNLTIYCEAETKPDTWSDDWNASGCNVVWGYNF